MRYERTHDMELVRGIVTDPDIWPHIVDELGGKPQAWKAVDSPVITYLIVRNDEGAAGLFIFHPETSTTWVVHTCLPREFWGRRKDGQRTSVEAAKGAAIWIFSNTCCHRITTSVPMSNRLALKLAVESGMVTYGRNPKAWLKDGKLEDMILLGISKPENEEASCQQP